MLEQSALVDYAMNRERQPEYIPEFDTDDGSVFPEKRLWTAMILNALVDYELKLTNIQNMWLATKKPVGQWMHVELRILRYEMEHDWFKQICVIADQSYIAVIKKLDAMDEEYGLRKILFTDDDTRVTRYQINKLKSQKQDA